MDKSNLNVLILAAGLGTRMGRIGRFLPKVLWPVFDKDLLQMQKDYIKQHLGLGEHSKIFINCHHLSDQVKKRALELDLNILDESQQLLGSGGGVHHCARALNYSGKLLIINGDQFLFFSKSFLQKMEQYAVEFGLCLSLIMVKKSMNYSGVVVDDSGFLKKIAKASHFHHQSFLTYSGVGVVDLSQLIPRPGVSVFFDTVAPYHHQKIKTLDASNYNYWDFGTLSRYVDMHLQLLKSGEKSYRSYKKNIFNLTQGHIDQYLVHEVFENASCPVFILNSHGLEHGQLDCSKVEDSMKDARAVIIFSDQVESLL